MTGLPQNSVSRKLEARAVAAFLASAEGAPSGLLVEGEAGIGKTTLWLDAAEQAAAQGFQVLAARGDHSEVRLAFAALADLLVGVETTAVIDRLPAVQRAALDRVLLRGNVGPASDERAAAAAFQGVVQYLADTAPVLIAIDDVQWLDTSSAAAIRFATRRLSGPVGVLVTARTGEAETADVLSWLQLPRPDTITRIRMTPLAVGGLHALISRRLGRVLPRPTMMRIHDISHGNPLYALELARAVIDGRGIEAQLPDTLAALVRQRVQGVDAAAGDLLLAAACTPAPTVGLVAAATGRTQQQVVELLESGNAAKVVVVAGDQIRFTHPLLATGVYTAAEPASRREMHRRLADNVETPELKARHLASAATSADSTTLEALDAAAMVTRGKGAPAAAAELLELAIRLGGDSPVRRIMAARHHFEAGSIAAARNHLAGVTQNLPSGLIRGAAVMLRGAIDGYDGSFTAAVEALTEGVAQVGDSPELRLQGLMLLAPAVGITGQLDRSLDYAREAVAFADQLGDPALRSQARAVLLNISFMFGRGLDETALQQALDLEGDDAPVSVNMSAEAVGALTDGWTGQLEQARRRMTGIKQQCADRGSEIDAIWIDTHLTMIDIWLADYPAAAAVSEQSVVRAEQMGGHHARLFALTSRAAVTAYTGQVDQARHAATAAADLARKSGGHFLAVPPTASLAFLEVSLGDHSAAIEVLEPLLATFDPDHGTEIAWGGYLPDAIDALVALGRLDDAVRLIEALERNGSRRDRPWMLAIGARGRALWLAARGELDDAEAAARRALTHHDRLPMPFEKARTQLVLGQLLRRRRRKQAAAEAIAQALRTFESIGAPLWAKRAQAEQARLDAAVTTSVGLTPAEERVARHAADGLSNKEIAAALFLAPKTVEMNLSRAYRKLGIRSRAQLHRRLGTVVDARENPDSHPPGSP